MHAVALETGTDPDRLSFTRSLRAARRSTASHPGLSQALDAAHARAHEEVMREPLPPRRNCAAAWVVKRKMSGNGVKTPGHHVGPQSGSRREDAMIVLSQ